MSGKSKPEEYTEALKKSIAASIGKTCAQIQKEYGASSSAPSNRVRKYSQVKADDDIILSARQIKAIENRNAEPEEEFHLKKAIATFTPHSDSG